MLPVYSQQEIICTNRAVWNLAADMLAIQVYCNATTKHWLDMNMATNEKCCLLPNGKKCQLPFFGILIESDVCHY